MYAECGCQVIDGYNNISPHHSCTEIITLVPWEKRVNFKVRLLIHRALYDKAPEYMRDMLQKRTNVWPVSSQLAVPENTVKDFADYAYSIAAPRQWTALPGSNTDCKYIGTLNKVLWYIRLNLLLIKYNLFSCIFICHVNCLRMACWIGCNINVLLLL